MLESLKMIDKHVKSWMEEVRVKVIASFNDNLDIKTKSGPKDLVTNIDREVEEFYKEKIRKYYPGSEIIGEESTHGTMKFKNCGLLWVIDPIDGTMNFVKQKNHFASMLAVYQKGVGVRGYIFDVMQDKLYWGGPDIGVYCNQKKIEPPRNDKLSNGLFGVGAPLLINNYHNLQKVALESCGTRIYGCSGIQFIHVLNGQCVAYISYLRPWDYAAGKVLAETLGLVVKTIDGQAIDMLSSSDVLVATKNAQKDITRIVQSTY
ncbi:myo-inositol-1(or 4)-monophosphatase [Liquorilactobacillus aquaticus DSM 21051]|uniref:Myo-inositol-1(Or 4)-monophosphatase n=1 Tax=Liquorilactobacillus aquaticus DSM 21051 TaxID=1423725 RepID=A0A0R2CX64_9LACO|nr:inositol monophosphatase family protein [Liquorilactobacillus aquaticus]KRM96511.1 myo-inositol-1(or 4)-monophosphatase [Liquorilactobacillus aquaticus DSM 21051]